MKRLRRPERLYNFYTDYSNIEPLGQAPQSWRYVYSKERDSDAFITT